MDVVGEAEEAKEGSSAEQTSEDVALEELRQIHERLNKIESTVNHINKRVESPWKKCKKKIVKLSKKETFTGRMVKKFLRLYRVSWRYLYCLLMKRHKMQMNKIVFISHRGKQYSCNPMYLCEYLSDAYPSQFELVWAFDRPASFAFLAEKGIQVVKKESREHLRHLMTAKVLVTNVDFFFYLPGRKEQIRLDTWHGGGAYKTCGFANAQNLLSMRQRSYFKRLYSRVNLYCSSSRVFTEKTIRESRLFSGAVLEIGMPRNDNLVRGDRPDIAQKVRNYFSLKETQKIVLYAPTYRSEEEAEEMPRPDIHGLTSALRDRFGGDWVCLLRQHHLSGADAGDGLSATDYPDMQELLYTADVLVSDYSSCIWDFSLMYKPVFLFCPDLEHYTAARDFYIPIEQWHFPLTHSQAELEEKIQAFDAETYRAGLVRHHIEMGNCETGQATKILCERIYAACFPSEGAGKGGQR